MRGSFFYALTGGFTSGILARSFFVIDIWTVCFVAVLAVALLALWRHFRVPHDAPVVVLALALLMCALGVVRVDAVSLYHSREALDARVGSAVVIEGVIAREADVRERTRQLTVDVSSIDGVEASGRVLVITDRLADITYGDTVRVHGDLRTPEAFDTDLGRTFNYPGYLSARGIYQTLSFADVEVLERGGGNIVMRSLFAFKRTFMDALERALPEPYAGLGEGLLLGVKRALGSDLESAFRATGIIHIVVLSGYNITIVAEAVMRLLAVFFMPRTRFMIGAGAIVAFAFLVGLSATVLRASIMALLVLIARATGKTYAVIRALVFSACVMLIINPYLLAFDPGFQLSFLATFGLILLGPLIERRLSLVPTRLQVREFVTATLSTQIFVLPLLLYSIGELSLVALPVNVLVLIVVPLAMLLTFLTGALGIIASWLALPVAFLAHGVLSYIIGVVSWFAELPYASVMVPAFPFWVVFLAYGLLVTLILYASRQSLDGHATLKEA